MLNYKTAPNVLVWSAACASCSVPEAYGFQEIFCKNDNGHIEPYFFKDHDERYLFTDGSLSCDIPIKEVGRQFGVSAFIVSQVNPHGAPFIWDLCDRDTDGIYKRGK